MKKLTYLFFCLSMAAFSFDTNNDLNTGIPISEKTSANKTYENPENNNFTFPENKGDKLKGQELKEEDMPVILYIYKN